MVKRAILAFLIGWFAATLSAQDVVGGSRLEDASLESVSEERSDGSRVEFQVRVDASGGGVVRHGDYRRWSPDGVLAEEGRFADGRKVGRWTRWHPNGERSSEEHWRRGLRNGDSRRWTTEGRFDGKQVFEAEFEEFADGAPRSAGECLVLGRKIRHGRWVWFWPEGGVRCEGTFERGLPSGDWRWYWWSGGVQFEGAFERLREDRRWLSRRVGDWIFTHRSGVRDDGFLSGRYELGQRSALIDTGGNGALGASLDSGGAAIALPPVAAWPGLSAPDERKLARNVLLVMAGADSQRAGALEALGAWDEAVLPSVLAAARELDLAAPESHGLIARLWPLLPTGLLGGLLDAWSLTPGVESDEVGEEERAAAMQRNRLQLQRWLTLWEWYGREPEVLLALRGKDPEVLLKDLFGEVPGEASVWNAPPPIERFHEPPTDPFEWTRDKAASTGTGTQEALRSASEWLCAQQADDGSWFGELEPTCLALVALSGIATAADEGSVAVAVDRGMRWLLDNEGPTRRSAEAATAPGPEDGLVAIALAESVFRIRDPALRRDIQRYFDGLVRARRGHGEAGVPEAHASEPTGTAWDALALAIGQRAGFRVLWSDLEWAHRWLAVSEARLEAGDTETAALLLWCRRVLGNDATDAEHVLRAAESVRAALPALEALGHGAIATWCYGAYGVEWIGGGVWADWNAAMKRVLLGLQGSGGGFGAADVDGVRNTALAVLALQVYFRYPWYGE